MNPRNMQSFLIALVVAVGVVAALWWSRHQQGANQPPPGENGPAERRGPDDRGPDDGSPAGPPVPGTEVHLALGNPSGATADEANRDNYLLAKPYYALSYNNTKGTPNWVSWYLRKEDLGTASRSQFYPDPDLPRSFKHVTPTDYTGSGFDRGHLCPRSDRTSTAEAANATFAMTNIIPQAPHVNQKAWADFEDYTRNLVRREHRTVYQVAGPAGVGGEGTKGAADAIGHGKVTVPAKCWKVVLAIAGGVGGPDDANKVTPESRLIAVVMPNDQSVEHGWAKYRVSGRDVEQLTGYRFFDRVPRDVLDPLKAKVDDVHVRAPRSRERGGE